MHRWGKTALFAGISLAVAGCPKGRPDFSQGIKAEALQDYDAAYDFYQKAAKSDPYNAGYKIRLNQTQFEASQTHVKRGVANHWTDSANQKIAWPVHKTLLGKRIPIIEGLVNLDAVMGKRFQFIGLPLKIAGADGSPVRAIAILNE